jgi:hypothetical protein
MHLVHMEIYTKYMPEWLNTWHEDGTRAKTSPRDTSIKWVPGWQPFHTNLPVFSSQADFQLTTELTHQPPSLLTGFQLKCTALAGSLPYSLRVDPTENTASSNPIVAKGSCLVD